MSHKMAIMAESSMMLFVYLHKPQDEEREALPKGVQSLIANLRHHGTPCALEIIADSENPAEHLLEALERHHPAWVGFSVLNHNRKWSAELSRLCKARYPEIKIIWGGPAVTSLHHVLLPLLGNVVDYFVVGEAEYSLLNLVSDLSNGKTRERVVIPTSEEQVRDLDELPAAINADPNCRSIITSRGCVGRCTFCASPVFKQRVRYRSSANVIAEIKELATHCAPDKSVFRFLDDLFTVKKERTIEICQALLEECPGLSWHASSRVDTIDDETLSAMSKAGCTSLYFGVESGNEHIRNGVLKKGVPTERIVEAFRLAKLNGILPGASFIVGTPGENNATISDTCALISEIEPLDGTFIPLQVFQCTELYADYQRQTGKTDEEIWRDDNRVSLVSGELDPSLTPERIREYQHTLLAHYYQTFVASLPSLIDRLKATNDRSRFAKYSLMMWNLFVQVGFNHDAINAYCPGFDASFRTRLLLLDAAKHFNPNHAPLTMIVNLLRGLAAKTSPCPP